MDKQARMKKLVEVLNQASKAYYQEDRELFSNKEYDELYDELQALEAETGIVMSQSPTQNVGYEVLSELEKETHESPMLSLDKTKSPEALRDWLGEKEGLLSWKMDGLTVVLTYRDGVLQKAVTRGNGVVGEVITNNARVFKNLPAKIPFAGEVVLRGEAVIKYSDFKKINEGIEDVDARYKNPRNLCSGSVRQLNNEVTAKRNVFFFAFALVKAEGRELENSVESNMLWVQNLGFEIVPYKRVDRENIMGEIQNFSEKIVENDFPSDGLVLIYDDIAYGISLGRTAKFPRNSIAFKWADEEAETRLLHIEWSPSRTGLINPIAVFEPVELEGTTVSRASLHNISIMEGLELGENDHIKVYKANMIIPQIAENVTKSGTYTLARKCPCCGEPLTVKTTSGGTRQLYCENDHCAAKLIQKFAHFCEKTRMNIEGLSATTLEKFISNGWIRNFGDLYELEQHREAIINTEGFGVKSYERLQAAIEKSRHCTLAKFIAGLGIPMVGRHAGRDLDRYFNGSWTAFEQAIQDGFDFTQLPDFGETMHNNIYQWYADTDEAKLWRPLLEKIDFIKENNDMNINTNNAFFGKVVVATGKLENYTRDGIQMKLLELGAKPASSVTKKTDYLIVGEKAGSKLAKAQQLGVRTLTEQEFEDMIAE